MKSVLIGWHCFAVRQMEGCMNCERFQQCSNDFSHTVLSFLLVLLIWRLTSFFTKLALTVCLQFENEAFVSHICFHVILLTHNTPHAPTHRTCFQRQFTSPYVAVHCSSVFLIQESRPLSHNEQGLEPTHAKLHIIKNMMCSSFFLQFL